MKEYRILYIHGMGGGGDSRIPSILNEHMAEEMEKAGIRDTSIPVTVRTYSFDPEEGAAMIKTWAEELSPDLIIGESLGAIQAIRLSGYPHLLVSPSLGAPKYLGGLSFLAFIPGMTPLLDHIYKPKEGDRQRLHFTFGTLRKYLHHRKMALQNCPRNGGKDSFYAFFGEKDHYRRSGVVSIRAYRKYFGDTYTVYNGTHFMEEEFLLSLLVQKIFETLGLLPKKK
ncbi:MAG: hypothetical protein IJ161_12760 [Bacteroidales bacterium]|nr:hypothetical protein [Bacteroidales bacterium]